MSNRVAIVTGAAQGLGLVYAQRLAEEGTEVVITDIREPGRKFDEWPDALKSKISQQTADVRSYEDVQRVVALTAERYGRIDILVNNAGIYTELQRKPFQEIRTAEWEKAFSVNVTGMFHCIKAIFPFMKAQKYGKIINIASDAVFKGLPNLLHYTASKGAVVAMTRSTARELGPYNITVNAIAPGLTIHEDSSRADLERDPTVIKLRSLKRTQTPEDLLGALVFLASPESDFITGQTLVIDGGEVFH